jgi:hypothetical protein
MDTKFNIGMDEKKIYEHHYESSELIAVCTSVDRAYHIVRCVNAHEALVAALEESKLEADRIGFNFPADTLRRIRAALKLAKGE